MYAKPPVADESPWLPFETRRRARDEKREAVLRTAARLFLEQGYHRATLDGVAKRLNITKAALYNYFRSKEEILFECWTLGQEHIDELIASIEAGGGTGLERLRKLIQGYAQCMATDYGAILVVRIDTHDLTEKNHRIVRAANKNVDLTFRRYLTEGMVDGSIKPCDVKLATFAIAGSLNWIAHWYQPNGALSVEAIAAEFVARLTEGLARKQARNKAPGAPVNKTRIRARSRRK